MAFIVVPPATHHSRKPSIRQSARRRRAITAPHELLGPATLPAASPVSLWTPIQPTTSAITPQTGLGGFVLWIMTLILAMVIVVAPHAIALILRSLAHPKAIKATVNALTNSQPSSPVSRPISAVRSSRKLRPRNSSPTAPLSFPSRPRSRRTSDASETENDHARERIVPSGRPGARVRFLIQPRPMPAPILCHSIFGSDEEEQPVIQFKQSSPSPAERMVAVDDELEDDVTPDVFVC